MNEKEHIIKLFKQNLISMEEALDLLEASHNEAPDYQTPINEAPQTKPTQLMTTEHRTPVKEKVQNRLPNLFDGLYKLNDEDLKYLIATLETMTLKNIFEEQGQKVAHHINNAYNYARNLLNYVKVGSVKVVSIEERINKRVQEISSQNRWQLQTLLRDVLESKVNSVRQIYGKSYTTQELSDEIIEIASLNFKKKIPSELPIPQKADNITILYTQRLQQQLSEKLSSENSTEQFKTEQSIQDELNKMSPQQYQELQEALDVQDLTGETVRKALLSSGGGALSMLAINGAGFGAYMALSTILHAVFTTMMGITLPFAVYTGAASLLSFITGPAGWLVIGGAQVLALRKNKNKLIYELLAQVVFLGVQSYGDFFVEASQIDLPDYMPDMERDKRREQTQKISELESEITQKTIILNQTKEKILFYKESFKKATEDRNKILLEKEKIEAELSNHSSYSLEEFKELQLSNRILEEKLKDKDNEIQVYSQWVEEAEDSRQQLSIENDSLENEISALKEQQVITEEKQIIADTQIKKNADKLEKRWNKLFKEIKFNPKVYKQVLKEFTDNDIPLIERILFEMIAADDPRRLAGNRGKMHNSGLNHIEFHNDSPGRIFYDINPNNSNQPIYVEQIVKHNNARYGK